uniref:Uncharacterized protein n=1 Tax=Panagrolaimus sp. PS1159 TaxID=55785 RepID=A0AC35GW17_9BILA
MSNFSKLVKNNNDMSILRTSHDGNDNDDKNTDNTDYSQINSISENKLSRIYTPETRVKAMTLLLYFSILMVLIPFSSMYFCYNYIFK